MLLSITTTHTPASELGYLLHKSPLRVQTFSLSFGTATVFYPVVEETRCTAVLALDVDPIGLVRGRQGPAGEGGALEQYVNDRPYVASSFLSVAIGEVYGSALHGRSKERPELAATALPFVVEIPALPSRGGARLLQELFEPLGYAIEARPIELDDKFPEWGQSRYFGLRLTGTVRLQELLSHLYVLIPVLDHEKHYWIGQDEVDKLLRHGGDWLAKHPARELITRRYLKHRRSLAEQALAVLAESDAEPEIDAEAVDVATPAPAAVGREHVLEARISLNQRRIETVAALIRESAATSAVDLGCGEGRLLRELIGIKRLERIVGLDVSMRVLEIARDRLKLERMSPRLQERLQLLHGALTYRDSRLSGFDVATVIEVIEHLDPPRLASFERVLFEAAAPRTVIVTTPNIEYNVRFETLAAGMFRHPDHRFEWTRAEFEAWAYAQAERFGYAVEFMPVGDVDPEVGPPTQLARFDRLGSAS
jgi:3' terminal RNA ribose 2'-O-methyltransferase Hen1